jgi:hypothetical protein
LREAGGATMGVRKVCFCPEEKQHFPLSRPARPAALIYHGPKEMGLLTILKKIKQKEKEIRLLIL